MDRRPIGLFDSGFGGLTVARAVMDLLPGEDLVYVGDTGRYPYGPRPLEQVRRFSQQITAKLVAEHGVKLVVVACNTAAAAGFDAPAGVPLLSVIEPGVRSALRASQTMRIGVIGTVGTVSSGAYQRSFAAADPAGRVNLTCAACPGFVEFVERGETFNDELLSVAEAYLTPIVAAGCDTLVLGCTHYPLLTGAISYVVGDQVTLVSSAEETAKDVYRELARHGLFRDQTLPPPRHRFAATGDPEPFARLARRFLGPEVGEVSQAGVLAAGDAGRGA